MNTEEKATQNILSFIRSDKKFLLLTGTHQNKKHILVLSLIFSRYPSPANILFRANSSRNIELFLSPLIKLLRFPKTGAPINIQGGYRLYVDTMNPRSWHSSPSNIDVAIVYPIDSLKYDEGDDCVQDLMGRNVKKIFLVSWTDNKDFSWTDQFNPIHTIYDAEEEDPKYHKRMVDLLSSRIPEEILGGLPDYAKSTPSKFLVQILCRGGCKCTRWAKLNAPYPGKSALRSAEMGQYRATCLKCGYEAIDNYNWFR